MATVREFLNDQKFDWETGRIFYQAATGYSPGWSYGTAISPVIEIYFQHPILDAEFSSGFGAPQCPRYIAYDKGFVYFPSQYDGATGGEKVPRFPEFWEQEENKEKETPYPGG